MQKLNWLYKHRKNITSQHGEDGVIEAIFAKIGISNKWCVDVGAGDGYFISNTWHWINDEKWSAVCIERDNIFYDKLKKEYSENSNVFTLHESLSEENNLDKVLKKTPIPQKFDLMSIDIDSIDYNVWEMAKEYKARVVIIEANPSIAPDIEFIQTEQNLSIGSSALSMVKLANRKGYELVAHLIANCIFVLSEEFDKLDVENNSLKDLFISPFLPKIIADMNGVHYLLKEGPWGYKELVLANELAEEIHTNESGYYCAVRALKQLTQDNVITTNNTEKSGFISHINYNFDIKSILEDYQNRMHEYNYLDISKRPSRTEIIRKQSIMIILNKCLVISNKIGFHPFRWYRKLKAFFLNKKSSC